MTPAPIVSVIIPAYNAARYLADAIQSALSQTMADLEVIVVNDGSTDGTATVVEGFGSKVQLISQNNRGVASARNAGIDRARGQFLAFLDADDVWLPTKLARQLECFNHDPKLGCAGCSYYVTDEKLQILSESISAVEGLTGLLLMTSNSSLFSSTFLIPAAVLDVVGQFDPALSTSADWDLATRIASVYRVDSVAEPLLYYRQHSGAMHRQIGLMEKDMSRVLTKAFASALPVEMARLKRRSFGNLYRTLSGSYYHSRDLRNALRCGIKSFTWNPGNLATIVGPLFGVRGQLAR